MGRGVWPARLGNSFEYRSSVSTSSTRPYGNTMSIEADTNTRLMAIFLVATLSSVFGSIGGYAIGIYGGGHYWISSLVKTSRKLEELTRRYGDAGIFIAALSPIPYKVLAWTAGVGRMDIKPFLFAGFLGRGIRFGLR